MNKAKDIQEGKGYKVGDRIDYLAGDTWFDDWATIIYFSGNGKPIAEMNRPGHDGCRWCHEYSFEKIRKHNQNKAS